ncbi:alcohol dehydrogenase catalytic domain-containing protein [Nonomuraea recticatena]|uniref:alcohol dehydrogenase catalytic domain-containing protein n=1 Tax=Nonomuraea recticatena TaxID=46178 RepID=UPI00360D586F
MVERYGGEAGVRAGDVPDPRVGTDDVLIRIHAASVNPLDLKTRDGEFKAILPYRVPFILGNDLAGVVVDVGAAVSRFAVGDEVYARPGKDRIGTFADLIAVHQDDVAIKPATLTMQEAASLPLVALTSWQALVERAPCGRARRSSSTRAPAAWAPSPSSWPDTWARPWPRPRAPPTSTW